MAPVAAVANVEAASVASQQLEYALARVRDAFETRHLAVSHKRPSCAFVEHAGQRHRVVHRVEL